MSKHKVHYRDNSEGNRLPDQQITESVSLNDAFDVVTGSTADAWLHDNNRTSKQDYTVDQNYQVVPDI